MHPNSFPSIKSYIKWWMQTESQFLLGPSGHIRKKQNQITKNIFLPCELSRINFIFHYSKPTKQKKIQQNLKTQNSLQSKICL